MVVAALMTCAPASASADPIAVSGQGAGVSITRSPFRMTFTNASGHAVLTETAAPLSYLVGTNEPAVFPASQWVGNLQGVVRAGVDFSARDVVAATPSGGGVKLTVSTNDPTGRQLIVTVTPAGRGAMRVRATPSDATGVATFGDSFVSPAGEAFHGFGGRHNALDQRGQDFYNWLDQENVGAGELQPGANPTLGDTYLFPNGAQAAYYVQSSFVSNRGYGFLLDQSELSHWRLASDRPDAWQVEVAAPSLDYVVAPGSMRRAAATLTARTGRQPVPPRWALGPMLDREVAYPSQTAASYQQQVEADLRDIARYRLPLTAYRIEGWQFVPKAWLRSVIRRLRARGIHPLVYFRAFVGKDTIGTDDPAQYDIATSKGYVATNAAGQPYTFVSNFNQPAALVDFTNPAAVRWWQQRIRDALALGADGFMLDFGEQTLPDMHFKDGSTGTQMHNRYPILYQRATRAAVRQFQREHPHRSFFFFTRAGYTGSPGTAAYENANFPGDETTDWSRSSGLASLAPDMLNRGIGGAFGFGTDIGGYFDVGPYQPTTKELFIRWAEWAALTPVFRLHGSVSAGVHTPWSFDQQTVATYNRLSRLHMRARSLIMRLWKRGRRTGMPIARPLYLAYPGDSRAASQDQEWLLGADVLVAPVVQQGATQRDVYFPRGCWRSPLTGLRVNGSGSRTVAAPLDQLPFFFRCGRRPFSAASSSRP